MGERIGWIDDGEIYLQDDSAYAVAQKLAHDEGDNLSVSLPTLKRRLNEKGLLASVEQSGGKNRLKVRRQLGGVRQYVLHLKPGSLSPGVNRMSRVHQEIDFTDPPDTELAGSGPVIGARTGESSPEVHQESAPIQPLVISDEGGAGSLGALGAPSEAEDSGDDFFDEVLA